MKTLLEKPAATSSPQKEEEEFTEDQIESFIQNFESKMVCHIAQDIKYSTELDKYRALAHSVRDIMITKWLRTQKQYYEKNPKRIYYLSLEFLMGRTLGNALLNLDVTEAIRIGLNELGIVLEDLAEVEWDAGLGNGGLGRLAACFLDSMATLNLPAYGYGIRYEYGMFKQKIEQQQQQEYPDNWLRFGNPWEIKRTHDHYKVHFKGRVNSYFDRKGKSVSEWVDTEQVIAVAHDVPIPGYKTDTVNTLKLWSAAATREFNLGTFNDGDYVGAIMNKNRSETISKVLYPNDNNYEGKELRLTQQYFMVSSSLQDILARFKRCNGDLSKLHEKVVIQLNDTHPSIAIPELMRVLLDEHDFQWDAAWAIVQKVFAYTNHTVLPEALEKWPVSMMEHILPRHMQIIYEINKRFLDVVNLYFPGDFERRKNMSIIEEEGGKQVRMAHLAIVGSFSVNGVAELHSQLLKKGIFKDFYKIFPARFNNKTNGVTPRRWIKYANPKLSDLITSKIGDGWIKDLFELKKLESYAEDETFQKKWIEVKRANKIELAGVIKKECNIDVEIDSIFDVHVKRVHEYKRQLLNVLHTIVIYNRIKSGKWDGSPAVTKIFAGKSAPGYQRAKEIIYLINCVANIVNNDPYMDAKLRVAFIPNYSVSLAESIIPGSDLSEQISTAGMEASGTGNMKFGLNGALTIGTLDGANVEMREEVGDENIFIFGLKSHEIEKWRAQGYDSRPFYENDTELKQALDQIRTGYFSPDHPEVFTNIFNDLVHGSDHYFILADFRSYIDCYDLVAKTYQDEFLWTKKAILNVARMGKFSTDRTIQEYADDIWNVKPVD